MAELLVVCHYYSVAYNRVDPSQTSRHALTAPGDERTIMGIELDPRTRRKLEAFARRRKRLIAVRGACSIISTVLIAMTVVAIVDLLVVLPDTVRIESLI